VKKNAEAFLTESRASAAKVQLKFGADLSAPCRYDDRDPFVITVFLAIKATWFSPTTLLLFIT